MKISAYIVLTVLTILSAVGSLTAQHSVLRYRERSIDRAQIPRVFSHGNGSPLYLAIGRVGVYTLTQPSFTPVEVAEMQNSDGYEFSYYCDCSDGDFLLHQRGFLGNRLTRLDSNGVAHKIAFQGSDIFSVTTIGNNVVNADIQDNNGSYLRMLTVDCGRTWFEAGGTHVLAMRGAALLQSEEPRRFTMARSGLGNEVYPSAIKSGTRLSSIALLGKDSIVWITRRSRATMPDTIWYASIRDSSKKRFDTVINVSGVSDPIASIADVELVATNDGVAFLFHRDGRYARYESGTWIVVDSLPPKTSRGFFNVSTSSQANNVVRYISIPESGQKLVTVFLDSVGKRNYLETLTPSAINLRALFTVSNEQTCTVWNGTPTPVCLYNDSGELQLLNSAVRDMEALPLTPILFGFTNKQRVPVVVPYNDCAVTVQESGIGLLESLPMRGENWYGTSMFGPRIQSTRGLRIPFIGANEVISPGDKVRQFTRDGSFVQVLQDIPATAVFRMPDTTLLIADGSVMTVLHAGGFVDSVDLTNILCSTSATAGYVNSITMAADGSLLAFTNGLRLLDLETLGTKPWRCGGIVRSLDTGRTFVQSTTPIETPYFLGSIRTPSGVLVASVTTVVRDSTLQVSDDQHPPLESKNHTFNDRSIIRSTDNGATWTQVYHSPSKSSFKLIGGDGTITKDGTLLLMTTDGVLQSTNDGLDWDFRDITGLEAGSQNVISMFQDTVGSAVYYCTINGLYEEQPLTTVHEGNTTSTNVHAARTWESHLSAWKKSGIKIKRLFSVLGYEVPTVNPPAGMYLAEYELHSETKIEPILVLVD